MTTPDENKVRDFYDGEYYADIKGAGEPTRHHRRLASRLGIAPGERVIDVACGTGDSMTPLLHVADDVIGLDASNEMVSLAKTRGLSVVQDDYRALPQHLLDLTRETASLQG